MQIKMNETNKKAGEEFGIKNPDHIPNWILDRIVENRIKAEAKHKNCPSRPYGLDRAFAIFSEEVGEVAECVVEVGKCRDCLSKDLTIATSHYGTFMLEKLQEGYL